MNILSKFKQNWETAKEVVKQDFAYRDLEVTTTLADEQNPAIESAFDSIYTPKSKKIDSYDYLSYGSDDKLDQVIDALLYKSATHAGILSKKAKMVAGNELILSGEESLGDSEKLILNAFKSRCGGVGKTLYQVLKEAAYLYEKDGGVGLDVTYDVGFKSIISIKAVPQYNFRCGLPDKNNEVQYFVKRTNGFKRGTSKAIPIKEEKIPAFDLLNESALRQFLYIRNPLSSSTYYGMPNYLGAYYFIAADFEFGKAILNSARNGFAPKLLATFIGRNMSTDQKREEAEKFQSNFLGSEGEQVILSWIRKKDDAPEFKTLDIQNLDKTISVMAQLDDSKILTAHNITSPTLFGIQIAGKLGGTGTELGTAYELFRATETLPNRQLILDAFQAIFDRTPYVDVIKLEIEDTKISFGQGFDDDNTDTTDNKNVSKSNDNKTTDGGTTNN